MQALVAVHSHNAPTRIHGHGATEHASCRYRFYRGDDRPAHTPKYEGMEHVYIITIIYYEGSVDHSRDHHAASTSPRPANKVLCIHGTSVPLLGPELELSRRRSPTSHSPLFLLHASLLRCQVKKQTNGRGYTQVLQRGRTVGVRAASTSHNITTTTTTQHTTHNIFDVDAAVPYITVCSPSPILSPHQNTT